VETFDLSQIAVAGMQHDGKLLWLAAPQHRLVATYDPQTAGTETRLDYSEEVWDVCPGEQGLWLLTGGGKLGRQIVLWSLAEGKELRKFGCPDGAAAGLTVLDGKLWMTHRNNRKLFCLDAESGKVNWMIRTEHEVISLATFKSELWLVEADLGPLGHWGERRHARYHFCRYDPARERVVERRAVPFAPRCMTFDGERFWYAEQGKKGIFSAEKGLGQL
jgi:hypothetical protein